MGHRLDDETSIDPLLRGWVGADRRNQETADRLEAIEQMISYWIPISQERDVRIEALERRLARVEQEEIPVDYSCIAELAARVDKLEATMWELSRRLNLP